MTCDLLIWWDHSLNWHLCIQICVPWVRINRCIKMCMNLIQLHSNYNMLKWTGKLILKNIKHFSFTQIWTPWILKLIFLCRKIVKTGTDLLRYFNSFNIKVFWIEYLSFGHFSQNSSHIVFHSFDLLAIHSSFILE
jgi:hypothetical protein